MSKTGTALPAIKKYLGGLSFTIYLLQRTDPRADAPCVRKSSLHQPQASMIFSQRIHRDIGFFSSAMKFHVLKFAPATPYE